MCVPFGNVWLFIFASVCTSGVFPFNEVPVLQYTAWCEVNSSLNWGLLKAFSKGFLSLPEERPLLFV